MIPHSCPCIGRKEEQAVIQVLRSQHIKGGELCRQFERRVAAAQGYRYGITTATGSHAIEIALRIMFADKKARIGISGYLCRSVYDAIVRARCIPVLTDADPVHFGPDLKMISREKMDAVIVAHLFGVRVPLGPYLKTGVPIIEDCAQRVLSDAAQEPDRGIMRILSFEATKLLTCGEGGMLLLDDEELQAEGRKIRAGSYDTPRIASWCSLTDIQAALANVQWSRLEKFIQKRREIAAAFMETIGRRHRQHIHPAMQFEDTIYYRFILRVKSPPQFIEAGARSGVVFRRPIAPLPLGKLFRHRAKCRNTETLMNTLVSIPIYPALNRKDMLKIIAATNAALDMAPGRLQ